MRRPGQHLLPLPPCRAEWCPGGHAVGALGGQSPCWCPGRQSLCWCPEGVTLLVPCGVGEWGGAVVILLVPQCGLGCSSKLPSLILFFTRQSKTA